MAQVAARSMVAPQLALPRAEAFPRIVLAIDPGTDQSAWLAYQDGAPKKFGIQPNAELLRDLRIGMVPADVIAIELIEPRYGVQMGWETLDTARLIGQLQEAAHPTPVVLLKRSSILRHLGVVTSPKKGEKRVSADSGVRLALMDRFGGEASIRKGGPLFGISKDVWSALAIAITATDGEVGR